TALHWSLGEGVMRGSRTLATGVAILAAVMVVAAPAHGADATDDTDQAGDINPVVDVEPASPAQERAFEAADEAAKDHYARLLAVRDAQLTSDRAVVENAQAATVTAPRAWPPMQWQTRRSAKRI